MSPVNFLTNCPGLSFGFLCSIFPSAGLFFFVLFNNNLTEKLKTWIIGEEGLHADHHLGPIIHYFIYQCHLYIDRYFY